jgi:peptidoglycan/xylan/chitin deacetylase (PgdA/CDA1 family)
MLGRPGLGGKRELLARALSGSGIAHLLSWFPSRDSLLVLNYHRIGNAADDLFDPGVFSATADELDDQIGYLKKRVSVVCLQEALAFIVAPDKEKVRTCRVLITFDDGYLDNYQLAFPILRSHGVQGVFFLATGMVGSCHVPWWDQIAFVVRTARKRQFALHYPGPLSIDIDEDGVESSLRAILKLYKRPDNLDPKRFIEELESQSGGEDLPTPVRRFLSWDEAKEMLQEGMAIGSHTHSHHVLSQLEPPQQREEACKSRAILIEKLGVPIDVLAYPVGGRTSFNECTRKAVEEAGYRAAFSFYGGINLPGKTTPYNVNRVGIGDQSRNRFRVQMAVSRCAGTFWP